MMLLVSVDRFIAVTYYHNYLALRFVLTSGAAAALMIVALMMPLRLAV